MVMFTTPMPPASLTVPPGSLARLTLQSLALHGLLWPKPLVYSLRRTIAGSMRAARRAGSQPGQERDGGQHDRRSRERRRIARLEAEEQRGHQPRRPEAHGAADGQAEPHEDHDALEHRAHDVPGDAPSAIRTPNSARRRLTA